jgi:hypothetical protein
MDNDMLQRARRYGLQPVWISDQTSMLHQWHVKKHTALTDQDSKVHAQRAWRENHQIMRRRRNEICRNPTEWGMPSEVVAS